MDGAAYQTESSALTHIALFLLIVGGGLFLMLEMTHANRRPLEVQDLSQPIPEMVRWQAAPN